MSATQAVPRWSLALVFVLGGLAYIPTLGGGFLGDDFAYIARFATYPWSSWPRLFVREWSEGLWGFQLLELRPTTALSFMIDTRLWGGNPVGYRITNLLLHLGSACLLVTIAWRASRGSLIAALAAGLLFVIHPIAIEPTTWITGRVDGLATLLALGFWLAADLWVNEGRRKWLTLSICCLAAGIFGKEFCLLLPPLLLFWWVLNDRPKDRDGWRRRITLVLLVLVAVAGYAVCRQVAFSNRAATTPAGWNDIDAWGRQVSYLGWLSGLFPAIHLRESPPILSIWYAKVLWSSGLGTLGILLVWASWRRRETTARALFFTYFWYLCNTVTLLAVGYFSPRHLYFSSTGIALGIGLCLAGCNRPWARNMMLASMLTILGWGHYRVSENWRTAGRQSDATLTAIREGAAAMGRITPHTLLLVEISEVYEGAWLWSWAAPFPAGRPFLQTPFSPDHVFTRNAVYYRPDSWSKDLRLTNALATADAALVVRLRPDGKAVHRCVAPSELKRFLAERPDISGPNVSMEQFFGLLDALLPL